MFQEGVNHQEPFLLWSLKSEKLKSIASQNFYPTSINKIYSGIISGLKYCINQ